MRSGSTFKGIAWLSAAFEFWALCAALADSATHGYWEFQQIGEAKIGKRHRESQIMNCLLGWILGILLKIIASLFDKFLDPDLSDYQATW